MHTHTDTYNVYATLGTLRDIEALDPEHQDAALAAMFKLPDHIKAKVSLKVFACKALIQGGEGLRILGSA
jgi:hypothetical protein